MLIRFFFSVIMVSVIAMAVAAATGSVELFGAGGIGAVVSAVGILLAPARS